MSGPQVKGKPRSRTGSGTWRKKRSDAGVPRGTYDKDEWKRRSAAFIEQQGGACEWCGLKPGDVYVDSKGKERKIRSLSSHHRKKIPLGLGVYKKLATKFFRDYFKRGAHQEEWDRLWEETESELHEYVEKKDIRARVRFKWDQEHRQDLDELYEDYKKWAEEEYLDLTPEKALVLCNRCHYAREKGLVICSRCLKKYHKPQYPMCSTCWKEAGSSSP